MLSLISAISQILRRYGCREIYGVGGDYAAAIIRGLDSLSGIELCPSSNEQHAAFAACASAEINGIGACLTTYMVGSIPCLSGAALAMAERLPVIFLSGCPGQAEHDHPVALHHSLCRADSLQASYDQALNAFKALGARAERLEGASEPGSLSNAAQQFLELVQHAVTHREPVFVEIPRDLVFAEVATVVEGQRFQLQTACDLTLRQLFSDVSAALSVASKPLLYVGDAVAANPQLIKTLVDFSRRFQVPIATDACAKGLFDERDPLSLGSYNGVFGDEDTRRYIEEQVDFVIEVGTSYIPRDICNAFNTGTHAIRALTNKVDLSALRLQEDQVIDLFETLLASDLQRFKFQPLQRATLPAPSPQDKLTIETVISTLSRLQIEHDNQFIYLPEIGSAFFASCALPTAPTEICRGWLANPWYGAMGTSLPYARAVARAIKRRGTRHVPLVIIGDGGFHFQLNELAHFQREELPLLILLLRNNTFGLGKSSNSRIYECSSDQFDALKLIEAYGGSGRASQTPAQLSAAIEEFANRRQGIRLLELSLAGAADCTNLLLLNKLIVSKTTPPENVLTLAARTAGAFR